MKGARWLLGLWLAGSAAAEDARTQEAARLSCASELGRYDLTLFANGTLRSRRWDPAGELEMTLAELEPGELAAVLERLGSLDLSEVTTLRGGTAGSWVETCALDLALPGDEPGLYRFGALDALPLALAQAVGIVEELWAIAEERRPVETLPPDYAPQRGDLLLAQDGGRYRVEGLTSDGKGVELLGLDQPLTIYVALESLHGQFRRLLERP